MGTDLVGGNPVVYAQFTLVNGQLGDDTDISDNRILSLGGPASFALPAAVPTLGGWGLMFLSFFMLAIGLRAVRRRAQDITKTTI